MRFTNKVINENCTDIITDLKGDITIDVLSAHYECYGILNESANITVNLKETGANATIHVIYLGASDININIVINHLVENTASHQNVRGIAIGFGRVKFNGKIVIAKDAQKSDGQMNHRGILLSKNALIDVTPELEIYADDVKCSHGSAMGYLNKNELFYLASRGIDEKTAKEMLLRGLLANGLPEILIDRIDEWMVSYV